MSRISPPAFFAHPRRSLGQSQTPRHTLRPCPSFCTPRRRPRCLPSISSFPNSKLQHPPERRGRSSPRSPAQSRLIASCLFFFAFEVRIPPTLPRAGFLAGLTGRGARGDPNPRTRLGWQNLPQRDFAGSGITRGDSDSGDSASASPGGAGWVWGWILHSQPLLLSCLIPPEPGAARGAGAASGHRERPRRRETRGPAEAPAAYSPWLCPCIQRN